MTDTDNISGRIKKALCHLENMCDGCKGCDERGCDIWITKQILRGKPYEICKWCCEVVTELNAEGQCKECAEWIESDFIEEKEENDDPQTTE